MLTAFAFKPDGTEQTEIQFINRNMLGTIILRVFKNREKCKSR